MEDRRQPVFRLGRLGGERVPTAKASSRRDGIDGGTHPRVGSGKGRKRPSAKAAAEQAAAKVKATIHLSVEADKRLCVHATMMEMDRSELVEKLINDHLRRYVVSAIAAGRRPRGGEAAA